MLTKDVKRALIILGIFTIFILGMLYATNANAFIVKDDFIMKVCKDKKYKRCDLVMAVLKVESSGESTSYNPDGSYGLMQVQCGTAQIFGLKNCLELFDPKTNISRAKNG
jgi:hypothetical protein